MHDRLVQAVLSPSTQRKLSTARSFNDALGLNATVPERVLAELDGRAAGALEEQSRLALAEVPQAAGWADRFTSGVRPSTKGFRREAAPTIVQDAVEGIAQACVPDPDAMLHDLLVQTIDVCAAWIGRGRDCGGVVDHSLWVSACQRTENQYR